MRRPVTLAACLLLGLAACDDSGEDFDVSRQIGPDPDLPAPSSALISGMKVA